MNIYQKIGTICLIGATAGLALGAALAGASAALEMVSDSVSSHKVKVIVVDAGEAQEEQWYKDQQYDFMLR